MWDGNTKNCPIGIKQNLNKFIGVLIPASILMNQVNEIVDFNKINKKNSSYELFIAIETILEINFISKAYLIYLTSNIESLLYTWFFNSILKNDSLSKNPMNLIEDETWLEYFKNKSKLNNFKHRYKINKEEKTFKEFIDLQTLGTYVFLIKGFKEEVIREILKNKVNDIQMLKDSLTISKELRNLISHSPYVNDIRNYEEILKKIDLKQKPERKIIFNKIFEYLDLVLKQAGYNSIYNILFQQINKELKEKNSKKFRINNNQLLTMENLKKDFIYKKK